MKAPAPMVDPYGRTITSLRVSLTERCNLNCIYCHREGHVCSGRELSCEEVVRACAAGFSLGIRRLKLTGGEPLLRDDLCEVLRSLPPFEDVSLTTNGTLLSSRACELKDAGLHRVNVSLDTLDPSTYRRITGGGTLKSVMEGIEKAVECELTPVKLNMVLLKGINDSEDALRDMLEFTHSLEGSAVLQLIELIPINGLNGLKGDLAAVESVLEQRASLVWERRMHRRRRYLVDGVEVEVVRPMDNTLFCRYCNRIRLTADGKLKPCLLSEEGLVDIKGLDLEGVKRAYMRAVKNRRPYYR
ncbi:GTP 3',8-cyclase MoaA [Methermicoccus shengliensis]|uniref:Probable GTP 3',8-cyclase n=1 Tax=Methermicoccus shengliensis TaxID=660064 RepID=A0A832RW57_9EURY|nr:GTP 3',8-cyclase MoaA [Methermicoccus shengliensis]KUK05017.1 MAG: putative cyclic pyranopterin monophosphate synthase [Euryarchaeota archaeon 55_53]KUK30227.1 MAG: putative cyclic pyranopterin monophosphate synthase [Methanosarcinales archeaon 56_1174]MDI3487599.1 3,8-cyclase [Methanosarcinales archaeon]MDN5294748.1 3,8-cyclase [Methanosarcinales archaeon]HIH69461.1 GTP 3',8-cyclase MoaA [Methermicoccus shengliensis]